MSKLVLMTLGCLSAFAFSAHAAEKAADRKPAQSGNWSDFQKDAGGRFVCPTNSLYKVEEKQAFGSYVFSRSDVWDESSKPTPDGKLSVSSSKSDCEFDLSLTRGIYFNAPSATLLIESYSGSQTLLSLYDLTKGCAEPKKYQISAESSSDSGAGDLKAYNRWVNSVLTRRPCK